MDGNAFLLGVVAASVPVMLLAVGYWFLAAGAAGLPHSAAGAAGAGVMAGFLAGLLGGALWW